ncbi:MAG: hypothetical protein K5925_04355 [Bacilli bacterium]|nr:hypothetical protein [Bacilli bacterium]
MNIPAIVVVAITLVLMVLSIAFDWKVKIKKVTFALYWAICLVGAIICLCVGFAGSTPIQSIFLAEGNINPLKILIIFLSCASISVLLDKIGFFAYIAAVILNKSKSSQTKLFFSFSAIIAILTVFTSNDILILTFTPFICYFAKNAKIDPTPFIISEFVCANVWSMFFYIDNPTNIYMCMKFDIGFFEYAMKMALPTISCGIFATFLVYLIFRKKLQVKIDIKEVEVVKPDRALLTIGVIGLATMVTLMAVSNYIPGVELWYIPLVCSGATFIACTICLLIKREKLTIVWKALLGLPYALIPFLLSMSVFTASLKEAGFIQIFADFLSGQHLYSVGLISFVAGNILNNIPMTMMFTDTLVLIENLPHNVVYAVIAASNITALLTPIGSLAGIMFMKILKQNDVKYNFKQFVMYGSVISIPTILLALTIINFVNFG